MSGRLEGRRAIVTGAASGIGAATVVRFRTEGAIVMTVDRAPGCNVTADLATQDGIDAVVAAAGDRLDILVNNAGIVVAAPIEEVTDTMWTGTLAINLTAAFKLSQALAPLLAQSPAGRILNTGSTMSSVGDGDFAAYAASKHGILGLTKSLANALGSRGITVNCVQPGATVTGMTGPIFEATPEYGDFFRSRSPLGRLGRPEDIANAFAFLASDDASFITGQGILVDGGILSHH
jgi:NAD(P)-dependent dehydrogenase (short-subunit alcohol dehydrogenase family)